MNRYCLSLLLLLSTHAVNAEAIKTMAITGGSYSMNTPGDAFNLAAFANNVNVTGGYTGSKPTSPGNEGVLFDTSIVTFQFGFFGSMAAYTAPNGDWNTEFAPPPSGDWTGNTLSLDLSSWTALWKFEAFNQGSRTDLATDEVCVVVSAETRCSTPIKTTIDESGNFIASWSAVVVGGPFNGSVGNWVVEGVVSTIPVPSAVWLFGSGLLTLISIISRKRKL